MAARPTKSTSSLTKSSASPSKSAATPRDRTQDDLGPEPVAKLARRKLLVPGEPESVPSGIQIPKNQIAHTTITPGIGSPPVGWATPPERTKQRPERDVGPNEVFWFEAHPHPATLDEETLVTQCTLTKGRSSGPGGQRKNKVETEVRLTHEPTGLKALANERRSAAQNRSMAIGRMRHLLATHARCPVLFGDVRSKLWKQRCQQVGKVAGRIVCNPSHPEYVILLAEAMDMVFACNLDMKKASLRLCCTPSQLTKFIKDHIPAFTLLNAHRIERGDHILK